ncbi:sulfated surface glycoprotein 185 isoform X2 [Brachypodium distachyon]|uniref:Bifunctional inhibitor/plant lipid transfer protein/seed storage helical domain-containing protein n=1 Tax=Brachypodium distachyon TaxID=15368 RepID=I1GSX4_BRADI|nr:sulfated surface glycoprotein 185 isoform X2 [Brachypodium distachyon]KQK15490.1 hypothetical protein BRADI_1g23200v3 [Brachypodium distachyon]|eukprot:XP_003562804.2 sulfated surface glycoprotein 185 isoform X2 [Brachypodium distachyon]
MALIFILFFLATAAADSELPPLWNFPPLPPLPPLPSLPPLPALPPLPPGTPPSNGPQPSPSPPPETSSCMLPLLRAAPCLDFLTNTSVPAPSSRCCDRFRSLVGNASESICICHLVLSDPNVTSIVGNVDLGRLVALQLRCNVLVPPMLIFSCVSRPIPPLTMIPSSEPAASMSTESSYEHFDLGTMSASHEKVQQPELVSTIEQPPPSPPPPKPAGTGENKGV